MADSQIVVAPANTVTPPTTPINAAPPPTVEQTPLAFKSTANAFAMEEPLLDDVYLEISEETRGHYLVGISPQNFLDSFLPWKQPTPEDAPEPDRVSLLQSVPPIEKARKEEVMYKPFVDALNGWVTGTDNQQSLVFKRFNNPDSTCGRMNVDIATYWEKDTPSTSTSFAHQQTHEEFKVSHRYDAFAHALDEGPEEEEEDTSQEDADPAAVAGPQLEDDDDVGLFEVKTEDVDDKLPDLTADVEKDTQISNQTRGQIAAYAGVVLSMAFRSHFFSMLIIGKYARFIRWDRRGAIVTHRFDYTKSPTLIFSFYRRYGQLTHRERGFDLSAKPWQGAVPQNVCEAFDSYYRRSWHGGSKFNHRTGKDEPAEPASRQRFFTIAVKDRNPDPTAAHLEEIYFVPAPAFRRTCLSPFTRATRRCLAFFDAPDKKDQQMCFMKDSWQETSARSAPEADIYRRLHSHGVENIASMRLGGDVDDLVTVTQDWFHVLSQSGKYQKMGHLVCHRLILNTVARDLSTFVWCKVLLSCLADAMEAAQQAYKAGVLHRDISAGNVMIVRNHETGEWKGILIDWDMCLLWEEQKLIGEVRTQRTGTWAFIAAELLMLPEPGAAPVIHSLWHDMESFFWVLLYQALRYLRHNLLPEQTYRRMKALFLDPMRVGGRTYGGDEKENTLQFCSLKTQRKKVASFTISGLNDFLETAGHFLHSRYQPKNELPDCDLNNPDDKWLPNLLRSTADSMAPLNVTRTALASPTNDSQPPADRALWKNASVKDASIDFFINTWVADTKDTKAAHNRHFQSVSNSVINFLDGLRVSHSSKRARDDIDDTPDTKAKTEVRPTVKLEHVPPSTKRVRRR
ncbi:hypothetical protein JR316_0003499 [Psilocybe cubensis]|uniref:Uncharacterized protein n=2 Tax=Psilocybe cubensis TaxID=181762 RepID=A0ACB8H8H6_PSICU|nr:hypothetical protein JR316_0003499 [Psilocybe cubensis]KAH9484020.1 hypothetical protein JR316_0003499 [Psilocybe cubensis]